jgi:glycosyltransferase involved in cell wall biosynthesis
MTRPCRSILMVGTHVDAMGGISTVVRGYREGGLFERFHCVYVDSHRDGSALLKAVVAVWAWARVLFYCLTMPAPLVHVQLSSRASFWRKSVVCLIARICGRPYLLHVHGSEFMVFYDRECGPVARRYVGWTFERAAQVLALSTEWRDFVLRVCPVASVTVLPNAVALPNLSVRELHPQAKVILSLGRVGQRKGSFDLISAFARLAPRYPEWRLICAGDGAVEEVRSHAERLGVAERVSVPGWLDVQATQRSLAEATLFALPSYAEGLPMALLEAMSWRLAIITSPVGGIPQVIEHEANGLLVTPGDVEALLGSLERLMTDVPERERLAAAARGTIESRFSREHMLDQLACVYESFGIKPRRETMPLAEKRSPAA